MKLVDPIALQRLYWPQYLLYNKQIEAMYSVWDDGETVIPAMNMGGKDFIAALICLLFFISRHPCRIVTTSAGGDHLAVLWGEIGRHIDSAVIPLRDSEGGPLYYTHQNIKKTVNGKMCPISYITGLVASDDNIAKMQGHHATPDNLIDANDGIPRTMFVADESSSVKDQYFVMASTWAKRKLIFGNTWDCANYFYRAIEGDGATDDKGGDIPRENGKGFHRRVIHIAAEDSPNVRYGLAQLAKGIEPDNRVIVPGVLSYEEYCFRRKYWDKVRQCVSLDARFYQGSSNLMYPPLWLNAAEAKAATLPGKRQAKAMGVDSAEGGDSTAWTIVDHQGIIKQISEKTPDTNDVYERTLALMKEYNIPARKVFFDRGGGGKQHADRLRKKGFAVNTVGFGESVKLEIRSGMNSTAMRKQIDEERYVYTNRRAQMYHLLRLKIEPEENPDGFGIPREYVELRRQMAPIPLKYRDGRIILPPKHKRDKNSKEECLTDLIGHSPDELDSLVLAIYGLNYRTPFNVAGAV